MKKVILFDLDGTLYRLKFGDFLLSPIYKEMRKRSIEFLIKKLGIEKRQAEIMYEDILKRYNHQLSIGFEKEFNINREEYFNYAWNIDASKHLEKDSDLKRILEVLSQSYTLSIVSDAPKVWITNVLDYLEIADLFQEIFSGESNIRKAFGNKFDFVLNSLKITPNQCFIVGDHEKEDIIGARELGIKTIYIGEKSSEFADHSIKDIYKIKDIFEYYGKDARNTS